MVVCVCTGCDVFMKDIRYTLMDIMMKTAGCECCRSLTK